MSVVPFKDSIPPGEPNLDMVEELERLLSEARSGELRGIAYATFKMGGSTGTGWSGSDGSRLPLGAAIMMLHSRYGEALRE